MSLSSKFTFLMINFARLVYNGFDMNYKLVLIVRTDIGMGKGKIASQCAHAAVSCYKQSLNKDNFTVRKWEALGQPKVVLKSDKGVEWFLDLEKRARAAGLVTALIHDAGRTQIDTGCLTVLGIGPASSSVIDKFTKELKLL